MKNIPVHGSPADERRRKNRRRQLIMGVVLLAFVGTFIWGKLGEADPNPETNCPRNPLIPISGYDVLIVDTTAEYSGNQQNRIRGWFEEIKNNVPKYGHLSLYLINEKSTGDPQPVIALCNPGTGEARTLVEQLTMFLTENPAGQRRRWEKDFNQPLDNALTYSLQGEDWSPILEMLRSISQDAFQEIPETDPVVPKRLYLVSDLLQNSEDGYSFYRARSLESRLINWDSFQENPQFENLVTAPFMKEVRVEALKMLGESGKEQGAQNAPAFRDFWEQYRKQVGVTRWETNPVGY